MMKASEYFKSSIEEMEKSVGDGYLRGDWIILDHTLINCPFYGDIESANDAVEYYKNKGWYDAVFLLETDYTDEFKYAVIAY